ncbi:TetR/AcrR family transcriptional regulator [Saccharothrix stipae]
MARKKDVQRARERLSAAVWSVLAERGLTGLTLRAVAERAGCTTGLVLHTFPDKRALLVHARETLHRRTAVRADAAEQGAPDAVGKLEAVLSQAVTPTDNHDESRVWVGFLAASLADPVLADVHVAHSRAFLRRLERLLVPVRPEWDDARRAQAAKSLVALVEGFNVLAVRDPDTYAQDVKDTAIKAAVAGLSRTGPAAGPAGPGGGRGAAVRPG